MEEYSEANVFHVSVKPSFEAVPVFKMLKAPLATPASLSPQEKENISARKVFWEACTGRFPGLSWECCTVRDQEGFPVLPGVSRMTDMVMREQTTKMTSRAMAIPFQFL